MNSKKSHIREKGAVLLITNIGAMEYVSGKNEVLTLLGNHCFFVMIWEKSWFGSSDVRVCAYFSIGRGGTYGEN